MQIEQKIALITGANKGIGLATARELGKTGWTVLLGARNPDLGHTAESELQAEKFDAHFVELDLNNPQTISLAASKVQREFGRLDVLVNNAGIVDGHDGPPSLASIDAVKRVMRTNFLGTVAVTQTMIRESCNSVLGSVRLGFLSEGRQTGSNSDVSFGPPTVYLGPCLEAYNCMFLTGRL